MTKQETPDFRPEQNWETLADDASLPAEGQSFFVSVRRWVAQRETLIKHNAPVGILFEPGDEPELLQDMLDDLNHIPVIALRFPAFTDGRNYSVAQILRMRYGYKGELWAMGDVLIDQVAFMARCGINRFDLPENVTDAELQKALSRYSVTYQPTAASRDTAIKRRQTDLGAGI
jgi:uncharacterized protein (DUF934 family)